MNKEWKGRTLFFLLLTVLVAELFLCLGIGSVHLSYDAIYAAVKEGIFGPLPVTAPKQGPVHDIIWMLRMPRLLLAACTGAGLAACGVVMQAIVKNPLADPYILGVSSGASLGAAAAILLGLGTWLGTNFVGVAAFFGAFGVSLLVLIVANIRGTADPVRLLLAGMALSTACSAISSFIIYFANDKSGVQSVIFWLMGSFAGARWEMMAAIMLVTLLGVVFFWTQSSVLDLMLLGDAEARQESQAIPRSLSCAQFARHRISRLCGGHDWLRWPHCAARCALLYRSRTSCSPAFGERHWLHPHGWC